MSQTSLQHVHFIHAASREASFGNPSLVPPEIILNVKLFLSIVIPSYNCEKTIVPLLDSICRSRKVDLKQIEIILVDDKSPDASLAVMGRFGEKFADRFFRFKIIALRTNRGPAHARNVGVTYAQGKVILFLDSDVILYKYTLFELIKSFTSDPDIFALTGVWSKTQRSHDFFPKFKALRDWSYWINERDPRHYYYLFSTRVAAIKRDLFLRLGGFNEHYRAALVEDIELTYRIARRYAVVFNSKVMVYHEFENFWTVAKKYFWRSFYWSKIYRERKKFDPVATTGKEALTTISAGGLVGSLALWLGIRGIRGIMGIGGGEKIEILLFALCFLLFAIHIWGVWKFLWFAAKEEGILFAVKSFFTGLVLYLVILAGAIVSFLPGSLRRPGSRR